MKRTLLLLVFGLYTLGLSFAQISIVNIDVTDAGCANDGEVLLEISGGTPPYCYRVDGGICQFSDQRSFTFTSLSAGLHTFSAADAVDSVSVVAAVAGSYAPPLLTCTVDGCQISAEVKDGIPPFSYAISLDGGPFSAYQSTPDFSDVLGNYCVEVLDGCDNISTYCGAVFSDTILYDLICCDEGAVGEICVQLTDLDGNLPVEDGFSIGGEPPFVFVAKRGNQEVVSVDGKFILSADCPSWSFGVRDVCGNEVFRPFSCISAELLCVNCQEGEVELLPTNTAGTASFYYLSDSGWQPNPNGINNPVFENIPAHVNGLNGFAFSIENECGEKSDTIFAECMQVVAGYSCHLGSVFITPVTDFFPVEVTCNSCSPNSTVAVSDMDSPAVFGIGTGSHNFTITNACGASYHTDCRDTLPNLVTKRSCNSIEAVFRSGYVCDGFAVTYLPVPFNVQYRLFLKSDPSVVLSSNSDGVFEGLTPGETYEIEAEHPDCGITRKPVTLYPADLHHLTYSLSPTSILDGAKCLKGYNLTSEIDSSTSIKPAYDLTGSPALFDSGGVYIGLRPGSYILATSNYCDTVLIDLPEWETDLRAELPACQNDACADVFGLRTASDWEDWGNMNGFGVEAKPDFCRFFCTDPSNPDCQKKRSTQICNFPFDSLISIYLYPNEGSCPVDTFSFELTVDDFVLIDSLKPENGLACDPTQPTDVALRVFGGIQPLSARVIDLQFGQVVATVDDDDQDFLIELPNLYSQKNYKVRVKDACNNSVESQVQVYDLPSVESDFTMLCDGQVRLFTVPLPNGNYTWSSPQGLITQGAGISSIVLPAATNPTTYTTDIQFSQCPPHQTTVDVPGYYAADVQLPFLDTVFCGTNQAALEVLPFSGNYVFEWNTGQTGPSIVVDSIGVYEVIGTTEQGCSDTASASIGISSDFDVEFAVEDVKCHGFSDGSITPLLSGGVQPFQFEWGNNQTTETLDGLQTGFYQLQLEDAIGCVEQHEVFVGEPPFFSLLLPNDQSIQLGEQVQIEMDIIGRPIDRVFYEWTPETGVFCPDCVETTLQPFETTTYFLTLTDENGCTATDSISISVENGCSIQVPNVISIRQNDFNSLLHIYADPCVRHIERFALYDRWGNLVAEQHDLDPSTKPLAWDGYIKGKRALPSVYFWIIESELAIGGKKVWAGDVTVLD